MANAALITTTLVDENGNKLFHPYVDTTGRLLVVPTFANKDFPGLTDYTAGPARPTSITTDPTVTINGVAASFVAPPNWAGGVTTRAVNMMKVGTQQADSQSSAAIYQLATKVNPGDTVAMSCGDGWASTAQGTVEGTGGVPLSVLNYSGQDTDWPNLTPSMGLMFNITNNHSQPIQNEQILANWARRMPFKGTWNKFTTTVTAWDVRGMPTVIASTAKDFGDDIDSSGGNSVPDGNSIPSLSGTWDLIYSDGSAGVSSAGPKLNITLISAQTGWTATEQGTTTTLGGFALGKTIDPGVWDATADNGRGGTGVWKDIKKRIAIVPSNPGNRSYNYWSWCRIKVTPAAGVGTAASPISFPPDANGMPRLAIFPPSAQGSTQSTLTAASPYGFGGDLTLATAPEAIDPQFITCEQSSGIRFMKAMPAGWGGRGDGGPITAAQLTNGYSRQLKDFLVPAATNTLTISSIGPLSGGADKLAADIQLDYAAVAGYPSAVASMVAASWEGGGATVSSGLFKITTSTPHGLLTGMPMTVVVGNAAPVPVTYTGYTITADILVGDTTIHLNTTSGVGTAAGTLSGKTLYLKDATNFERVLVTAIGSDGGGPFVTVTRAQNGSTAHAFTAASTTIRPCISVSMAVNPALVISATEVVAVYGNLTGVGDNCYTADITETYSTGGPTLTWSSPPGGVGVSYEQAANAVSKMAERAPSRRFLCWINVGWWTTDAACTLIANQIIPYLASNVDVLVELSNEVWNITYPAWRRCTMLATKAPNPETGGIGFADLLSYAASRSYRVSKTFRDAFTAAGLDPNRVTWGCNGRGQFSTALQTETRSALGYRQAHNLATDSVWIDGYVDSTPIGIATVGAHPLLNTWASWLPAGASAYAPGAIGTWTVDVTRGMIMSYLRAFMRYGIASRFYYTGVHLTRLNNGISVNGNAISYTYTGKARIVIYEGTPEYLIPDQGHYDVSSAVFPNISVFEMDMVNDPRWYWVERAFYQMLDHGAYAFAKTAGTTIFRDPEDARVRYLAIFADLDSWGTGSVPDGVAGSSCWTQKFWMGQRAGRGDGTTLRTDINDGTTTTLNQFGWAPLATITLANNGGSITSTATTFNVSNGSSLKVNEFLKIESEWMKITAVAGNAITITRHVNVPWTAFSVNTIAATHADGALVLPSGTSQWQLESGAYTDSVRAAAAVDWTNELAGLTVPTITWADPADITYPTALSATQLNATSGGVPGTFAYNPPSGTVLPAGNAQALSTTFTPTDLTTYATATKTVHINVLPSPLITPTITWPTPAPITYPTPLSGTQLNATSGGVPGTFVYSPPAGHVITAGPPVLLSTTFTPTDTATYTTANAFVSLTVNKGTPTITWADPADINFGTALSATQLNATASVPGTFVYTPASGAILAAGNGQVLSVVFTPTDTTNYTSASDTASINVLPVAGPATTPTITWPDPAPIVVGQELGPSQLNATANAPGTFAYNPPTGTRLAEGDAQLLSVTFTPDDPAQYTTATGTAHIDVLPRSSMPGRKWWTGIGRHGFRLRLRR